MQPPRSIAISNKVDFAASFSGGNPIRSRVMSGDLYSFRYCVHSILMKATPVPLDAPAFDPMKAFEAQKQ